VPRQLEIKLAVSIVLPLIELIRQQADLLKAREQNIPQDETMRLQISSMEVQRLLGLFSHPDFPNTGRITIAETACPTVLRACSFLRLQLRGNALSAISDEVLETGLDLNLYTGEENRNVTCYSFLATLQEEILKRFPIPAALRTSTVTGWRDLYSAIGKFFPKRRRSTDTPAIIADSSSTNEAWQVVVLNDPVNLMSYVTGVFRSVLNLPEKVAQQRMREVHELKSSMVWQGPKDQAEANVRALQSWHLQAVLQRE